MGVTELRSALTKLIGEEEDPAILEAVYTILNRANRETEIREEMYRLALQAEEDIKEGRVFTLEEAKARINAKFGK